MKNIDLKSYHKKLAEMYKAQEEKEDSYDHIYDDLGCYDWDTVDQGDVEHLEDRFRNCPVTEETERIRTIAREVDKLEETIDTFICQDYSKAVFEYYSNNSPILINQKTKEKEKWGCVFGNQYEILSRNQKYTLVGLVENFGPYAFE